MFSSVICLVGADKRLDYLAEYLQSHGFLIRRHDEFCQQAIKGAGLLIGHPALYEKGVLLPEIEEICLQEKVPVFHYMTSENFLLENARLTAEGFLSMLIACTPFCLNEARILLLGLGRCGKALRALFETLDLSFSSYDVLPGDLENPSQYNVVVNTIPAQVFTRDSLKKLNSSCILFEIASPPGGFDREAVRDLQLTLIPCPAIPGKTSPKSAGYAIGKTVLDYLNTY